MLLRESTRPSNMTTITLTQHRMIAKCAKSLMGTHSHQYMPLSRRPEKRRSSVDKGALTSVAKYMEDDAAEREDLDTELVTNRGVCSNHD
jgi:hypothetical protein